MNTLLSHVVTRWDPAAKLTELPLLSTKLLAANTPDPKMTAAEHTATLNRYLFIFEVIFVETELSCSGARS